ncbi:unnamed protein product, partial [Rotaria sordida]
EDQDIMEADLDLGDKLHASDKELSGDKLIIEQYTSQNMTNFQMSYSNILHSSSTIDPVLHRPITPGQLRHSRVAQHTIDSFANNFSIDDIHNDEYENKIFTSSTKKSSSINNTPIISNDQEQQKNFVDNFNTNNDFYQCTR